MATQNTTYKDKWDATLTPTEVEKIAKDANDKSDSINRRAARAAQKTLLLKYVDLAFNNNFDQLKDGPDKNTYLRLLRLWITAPPEIKEEILKEVNERFKNIDGKLLDDAKKKYKYNILNNGINNVLLDIRNYKNFRSVYSKISNYNINDIKNTIGFNSITDLQGTNPSKSYYMSNSDFLWSNSIELIDNRQKPEVQSIIFNEFQPDTMIYLSELVNKAAEIFGGSGLVSKFKDSPLGKVLNTFMPVIAESAKNFGKQLGNSLLQHYSMSPSDLYEPDNWNNSAMRWICK